MQTTQKTIKYTMKILKIGQNVIFRQKNNFFKHFRSELKIFIVENAIHRNDFRLKLEAYKRSDRSHRSAAPLRILGFAFRRESAAFAIGARRTSLLYLAQRARSCGRALIRIRFAGGGAPARPAHMSCRAAEAAVSAPPNPPRGGRCA